MKFLTDSCDYSLKHGESFNTLSMTPRLTYSKPSSLSFTPDGGILFVAVRMLSRAHGVLPP